MPVFFMGIEGSAIHYFMFYCVRKVFLIHRIRVSKGGFQIFDCQIVQSRGCFVPLSENKKI